MGSKPVFVSLQELFPQIDSRLLKATAIEHYDDVNAAVGFIINEVLPTIYGPSVSFCSTDDTQQLSNQACYGGNVVREQKFEASQLDPISSGACERDAKNSKETFVAELDLVANLEEPPECLAESDRQASSTTQDIVATVQELEQILQHAKQTKNTHEGEVYGEKAILASEARQFQSRLLGLSNEKDKAFSISSKLCEALRTRIAAAKDALATARVKSEKEKMLQLALKEEEVLMDTILLDSKRLQQEAEENTKLRKFLVESGRIVDTLQGEMAVIMEDLMLLKQLVDEHAPIKGTALLKTYGTASSSSSTALGNDSEEEHYKNQEPKLSCYGDEQSWALDDDWEMLRNDISRSATSS